LQGEIRKANYLEHQNLIISLVPDKVKADPEILVSNNMNYDFSEPPQPTHYLGCVDQTSFYPAFSSG
jgi:hypothetical protein